MERVAPYYRVLTLGPLPHLDLWQAQIDRVGLLVGPKLLFVEAGPAGGRMRVETKEFDFECFEKPVAEMAENHPRLALEWPRGFGFRSVDGMTASATVAFLAANTLAHTVPSVYYDPVRGVIADVGHNLARQLDPAFLFLGFQRERYFERYPDQRPTPGASSPGQDTYGIRLLKD